MLNDSLEPTEPTEPDEPAASTSPLRIQARNKRQQRGPSRQVALAVCALFILAVGVGVGIVVYRNSQYTRLQKEVNDLLTKAQTVCSANDIAGAAKLANDADRIIKTSKSLETAATIQSIMLDFPFDPAIIGGIASSSGGQCHVWTGSIHAGYNGGDHAGRGPAPAQNHTAQP